MPIGIYVKKNSTVKRGDIVAICLNATLTQLGFARHYLKTGFYCNGAQPLIKQVIAIPGDKVRLTHDYLQVNQIRYFYPKFYHDSHGNPLMIFPLGAYQSSNSYWLLGTHSPYSWDSRYWGPVETKNIIENLHPLLTQ